MISPHCDTFSIAFYSSYLLDNILLDIIAVDEVSLIEFNTLKISCQVC